MLQIVLIKNGKCLENNPLEYEENQKSKLPQKSWCNNFNQNGKISKGQKKVIWEKVKDHACFAGLQTFQERACKVLYRLDQKISHSRSIILLICVFTAPMST